MKLSPNTRLNLLIPMICLCSASLSLGQIIRDGQKVPKLKKVFVLSNGGPTHWHETVEQGSQIMLDLGRGNNPDSHQFEVFVTASAVDVTAANLRGVQCLVMNNVSSVGKVLSPAQKAVVEAYITAGGGTAGWHATSDTGSIDTWAWFVNWISAVFTGAVAYQHTATMTRTPASFQAKYKDILGNLPESFEMSEEEWYEYKNTNPANNKNNVILLGAKPTGDAQTTYPNLPYVWVNDTEMGGRFWETGFGHNQTILARTDVQEMIYRGVVWAGGGWDLGGCMTKGDIKFNAAATIACTNCCGSVPILVQDKTDSRSTETAFSENLAVDFSVTVNALGKHVVRIYDVGGKLVGIKQNEHPMRYEFPEVAKAGIYFVKVSTVKKTITKRVERL